jgi:hypothetical protein
LAAYLKPATRFRFRLRLATENGTRYYNKLSCKGSTRMLLVAVSMGALFSSSFRTLFNLRPRIAQSDCPVEDQVVGGRI